MLFCYQASTPFGPFKVYCKAKKGVAASDARQYVLDSIRAELLPHAGAIQRQIISLREGVKEVNAVPDGAWQNKCRQDVWFARVA